MGKRLFISPSFIQLLHFRFDFLLLSFMQLKFHFQDDSFLMRKAAVPIGKIQRFPLLDLYFPLRIEIPYASDDIFHLSSIGARIHDDPAADTSRYAACEFQPAQFMVQTPITSRF